MTLVVTYEVPNEGRNPDLDGYHFDTRVFAPDRNQVATCIVFIPRLELIYIENNRVYCTFLGGSTMKGKMMRDGLQVPIGPNRVVLRVDASSYALQRFLIEKAVSNNLTYKKFRNHIFFQPLHIFDDSIIHPAVQTKLPGRKWPLNSVDQRHLEHVLPVLTRTHHSIAYVQSQNHENHDDLGMRIRSEIESLVSILWKFEPTL